MTTVQHLWYNTLMKTLKQRIIDSWLKTKIVEVRPSYGELAQKYKVSKSYCYQVITEYLKTKEKDNERFI